MADILACDNFNVCGAQVLAQGSDAATVARARAKGWHIYSGPTLGNHWVEVILCDACVGSPRARLPRAPKVLEGQGELF